MPSTNEPSKPSSQPYSEKLTAEEKDRVFKEAMRHVQLNQEQAPIPLPRTPEEEALCRRD